MDASGALPSIVTPNALTMDCEAAQTGTNLPERRDAPFGTSTCLPLADPLRGRGKLGK
jgi:hypothetical protein